MPHRSSPSVVNSVLLPDDDHRGISRLRLIWGGFIAVVLIAFTFVLVAGSTTVFPIIAVASFVLLALAGPRRGDIYVLDDHMVEAGRPFRVAAVLDS